MNRLLKLAYQPYKWIIVIPFMLLNTFLMGLVCILVALIFKSDAANLIAVAWARIACIIAPVRVVVRNQKHYRKNTPYVVVANHQSMVDIPVVLGFMGLNIKWVMKKELGRVPIFGAACRRLGCIFVDRANRDAAIGAIQKARVRLTPTAAVLFFAEGTRSRDGRLKPFKKGAFVFALKTGIPILPITIKDTILTLPSDSLDLEPGTVEIVVHPPVHILPKDDDRLDEIIETTRRTIDSALPDYTNTRAAQAQTP